MDDRLAVSEENTVLNIKVLDNGLFESNTWLIGENGFCTVIDCGAPAGDILTTAKGMGCSITHIILTHGHIDHISQVEELKTATDAQLCMHLLELALYQDNRLNGCGMFGLPRKEPFPMPDRLLQDGELVETGGTAFRILHTPGHTAGGICAQAGEHLFSGDTLFRHGIGRHDLPTGEGRTLIRSIRETLYTLDPDTIVHCGHGPDTTIREEREHNPFVNIR